MNRRSIRFFSVILLSTVYLASGRELEAKVIGTFGNTYKILERDMTEELKEAASKVNWDNVYTMDRKKLLNMRLPHAASLPKAIKDSIYTVDMTWTLDFDIFDEEGRVLEAKGKRINPFDHVTMDYLVAFVNGDDPAQIEWFRKNFGKRGDVMLLVTDGAPLKVSEMLNKGDVYQATTPIVSRFQLRHVPCVVRQVGKKAEVREYYVSSYIKTPSVAAGKRKQTVRKEKVVGDK